MAKLRMGDAIRLSGDDAQEYCEITGRATLPKSVSEFNRAMQDTANAWRRVDCPEGDLLAALAEAEKI
jgi:hypothetical protein